MTVRVMAPPVPLRVIVNVPVRANACARTTNVVCPVGATGFGENEPVTQLGSPDTDMLTALENPPKDETVTAYEP